MLLSKIKQYSVVELFRIAIYKIIYKSYTTLFKLMISRSWSVKYGRVSSLDKFVSFIKICDNNVNSLIEEADTIVSGKVELFGLWYDYDPINGWLVDPISKRKWSRDEYFVSAKVKGENLGDVKYILELNKFNHLVRVALTYYYTNDDKYLNFIIGSINGWRNEIIPYRSVCQRIIMDMGFRIINLIQISILCSKSNMFSEICIPKINGIIYDQVSAIHRFHTAKWFKTGNGNNHVTGEMIGAIVGSLWLEYLSIFVKRRYNSYMKYLIDVLDRTISSSGCYLEQSDNYARVVYEFLTFFDIFSDIVKSPYLDLNTYKGRDYTRKLYNYILKISYHTQLPNIGDNDDAKVLTVCRDYLVNSKISNDIHYENSNYYLDESSWCYKSNDENDLYIYTRVGKFAFFKEATRIHAHNDILSIIIGVKGEMLFVDKGCFLYNQGAGILMNDRKYSSHNTACIDGLEINRILSNGAYLDYPISNCLLSQCNSEMCDFMGELNYYGVTQRRSINYENNIITIIDSFRGNLYTKKGHIKYILNKNFNAEKLDNNSVVINSKDGKICFLLRIYPVCSIEIENTTYSPAFARMVESQAIVGYIDDIDSGKVYKTEIFINK